MAYRLIYPDSYIKRAKKFLRKLPEIHNQYRKTLELLELDPHHLSRKALLLLFSECLDAAYFVNRSCHPSGGCAA